MLPLQPWSEFSTFPIWGILVLVGIIIAIIISYLESRRLQLQKSIWVGMIFTFVTFGILGMRLYHFSIIKVYGLSSQMLIETFSFKAGVDSFGIVLGCFALVIFFYWKKVSPGKYVDSIALSFPVLIIIVRTGCLLVLDEVGMTTTVVWGVYYHEALRHPIGLYYILNGFVLLGLVYFLRALTLKNGNLFLITLLWYGLSRFILDFFRYWPKHEILGIFSVHQVFYGISALGILGYFLCQVFIFNRAEGLNTKKSKN